MKTPEQIAEEIDEKQDAWRKLEVFSSQRIEAMASLITEALAQQGQSGWMPIEIAPKTGETIYGFSLIPYRWKAYKPQAKKQGYGEGRWQCMNDYGGWENCEAPHKWSHGASEPPAPQKGGENDD